MFRGAAIGLIYNRTLSLRDGVYDEAAAVTLQSTDIERLLVSLISVNVSSRTFDVYWSQADENKEVWSGLFEVAIGIWLLSRQLGAVSVTPVIVILSSFLPKDETFDHSWSMSGCTYSNSLVAKSIGNRQANWAAAVQRRVAITSSMLGSMKSVKMMGLSTMMTDTIQGQRQRELDLGAKYRWSNVWLNSIGKWWVRGHIIRTNFQMITWSQVSVLFCQGIILKRSTSMLHAVWWLRAILWLYRIYVLMAEAIQKLISNSECSWHLCANSHFHCIRNSSQNTRSACAVN